MVQVTPRWRARPVTVSPRPMMPEVTRSIARSPAPSWSPGAHRCRFRDRKSLPRRAESRSCARSGSWPDRVLGRRFQPAAALAFTRPYWMVRTITERGSFGGEQSCIPLRHRRKTRPLVAPVLRASRGVLGQNRAWPAERLVRALVVDDTRLQHRRRHGDGALHLAEGGRASPLVGRRPSVTFATTDERGVRISFVVPVAGMEPSGVITRLTSP